MARRTGGRRPGRSPGSAGYVPDAGHLVWLSFSPQAGREQAGRRPPPGPSPPSYNERAELCLVCPVTTQAKGYPFEVPLPEGLPAAGVVLADHLKSADWKVRQAEHAGEVPPEVLAEVQARLKPLLGL